MKNTIELMKPYVIAEYRYQNEHKGYYVYFDEKQNSILGKFLSILSNKHSIKEIDRILQIIDFINTNKSNHSFETDLDKEFGCDFWNDIENEYDKGLRYGQRVGDSTGYNLGRVSTILYFEHYTSLLYDKYKNQYVLISDYQSLETKPSYKSGVELKSKLTWWKNILHKLWDNKMSAEHILNYPMKQEDNIKRLKEIDPNYEDIN